MRRAETRRERCGLLGRAIHDREVEAGLRERERGALGHRRDADERDAARRSRDPFAQELHGDLRERYAALAELRLAAHARRYPERFLEHQPQARAAKAELERALLRGANLSHDLGLADARGVEAGRGQKKMLGRSLAVPCAQAPLRLAVDRGAAGQQRERGRAQILRRRAVAASEDQLDAIAGREVGELLEAEPLREIAELLRRALLVERELGERFAAALTPGDADQTEVL